MAPDGSMRRFDSILDFGKRHGIRVVTVADLIEHRVHYEPLVVAEAASKLPTRWGEFDLTVFRSLVDDAVHLAMTMGEMDAEVPTLVRVHRSNMLSDAFEFALSRSRHNLDSALQTIADEGRGALIHLESDQTAESMANVLDGYVERSQGRPWPPKAAVKPKMDFREFGVGAQILRHLGLGKIRVLTNQPMRLRGVSGFGLEIVEWLPVGKTKTADSSTGATS
jgi:3,4-dihydroxy 2-butanone 4-phosphate synthase/GTP cyclohydrolase II